MQLTPILSYSPSQNAHSVNTQTPIFDMHHNSQYLAFNTRNSQLILRNLKTGRTHLIHKSTHGIVSICFINQQLLMVQKDVHQIIVFSLRSQQVQKRLTGHRTQVTKLAYCRHRQIFASISHDVCLIFNQINLTKLKTLKCSTSSFTDITFSLSGDCMLTCFKDSSIFIWNLNDYSSQSCNVEPRHIKTVISQNSILAVFNSKTIQLANIARQTIVFQSLEQFWGGVIINVAFVDHLLVVNTDRSLYLVQFDQEHKFIIRSVKEITQHVNNFIVVAYQSQILILGNNFKEFSIVKVEKGSKKCMEVVKNPLRNEGLVCAGGYSNQNGCFLTTTLSKMYNPDQKCHRIQNICQINYKQLPNTLSIQKLKDFIQKHNALPDKHRPLAYRYLLKLPINPQQFRQLQNKGRHQCVDILDQKYPLNNNQLAGVMKDVVSLLGHYHPIFAVADNVASIVFPFVCLFGNDTFLTFQILYRLFTGPLSFLFKQFPVANSRYLQNMHQLLLKQDPLLLNHLTTNNISFTKIAWGLLSSFFTTNLSRDTFLAIVDNVFVRPQEPEYVMFVCLGYLVYNRIRIFTIKTEEEMERFFQEEHTVHTGKLLAVVQKIADAQCGNVFYEFQIIDLQVRHYQTLDNVPKDAIKMYQGRRKLMTEQLLKHREQQCYKDNMLKQMQKMTVKAKRDAQRQNIERQAYTLLSEYEKKNKLVMKERNKRERMDKIKGLIEQLMGALGNQKDQKELLMQFMPAYQSLEVQSSRELDQMQLKLMSLLAQLKPNNFTHPLKSQPFSMLKPTVNNQATFKASMNSNIANKMWQIDYLQYKNQEQNWQNNLLKSMKA